MKLHINEHAHIQWCLVGDHATPVMVVDDFLANAADARVYALGLAYSASRADYYPGLKAIVTLDGANDCARWIATRFIERLFGAAVPPYVTTTAISSPRCVFSVFACNRAALPAMYSDKHVDSTSWLASVLHLSHVTAKRGTALWQHRPSGLQSWPIHKNPAEIHRLEMLDLGLKFTPQLEEAARKLPQLSGHDLFKAVFTSYATPFSDEESSDWRLLKNVDARFNRLVVYPTWQIHSIVDMLDIEKLTIDNARLTMNQFIDFPVLPECGVNVSPVYAAKVYAHVDGLISC